MKRNAYIIIVLLFLMSCEHEGSREVVVIEKTRSYHMPKCSKVMMADTKKLSIAEARRLQFHPCPYCNPDQSL
jgi:hypothetical protein